MNGAGAAAISCSRLYEALGARHENFLMFDRKGVLHKGRTDLDELKIQYANGKHDMTLAEAMKDADVFIGLSSGNCVTAEMVKGMAKNPIVFAMANPILKSVGKMPPVPGKISSWPPAEVIIPIR